MASLKAEKTPGSSQPVGTTTGTTKKEPAKGPAPKQGGGPAKGEQKPRETRKKVYISIYIHAHRLHYFD